jgi:putative ATP-dependent endonuclease of OLD family
MFLSSLKLWNFRKYGSDRETIDVNTPDLFVPFRKGLNVLIGENDSGKSAIIDAIRIVLKTHSYEYFRVDEEDFYKNSNWFRIELVFSGLESFEAKNFVEWLGWTGKGIKAVPYLRIVYDVARQLDRILPSEIKAGVDDEGQQLTAEAREYLKVTYLKPLRDAANELISKRNSRFSQILLGDSSFKAKGKDHELVKLFGESNQNLKKYFLGEYPVISINESGEEIESFPMEGNIIREKIEGYIKNFYGNTSVIEINTASDDLRSILEKLTVAIQNEINPGLGTLNRLFMATELLHLNKPNWSGLRLGLIEELEAHLHPQAQMQVIEALQKQDNIQLILTTHSPNLASKIKLNNFIICEKEQVFPMGSEFTKLGFYDYKFLERFLDTTKANLFFAKGVILVEGWAEEILIPSIAKKLGINLTEKGISIINVTNLSFLRYSKIFQRKNTTSPAMTIPIAIVTDLDIKPDEEIIIKGELTLKQIIKGKKENKYNGDSVKTFVSEHWTLEYCLGIADCLRKPLFAAVKLAGREMNNSGYSGKMIDQSWNEYSCNKSTHELSQAIYTDFIGAGKKISKSIIAQYLAHIIDNNKRITKESLENETSIKHLIDAIHYVTTS